jgi:hypothetical protein
MEIPVIPAVPFESVILVTRGEAAVQSHAEKTPIPKKSTTLSVTLSVFKPPPTEIDLTLPAPSRASPLGQRTPPNPMLPHDYHAGQATPAVAHHSIPTPLGPPPQFATTYSDFAVRRPPLVPPATQYSPQRLDAPLGRNLQPPPSNPFSTSTPTPSQPSWAPRMAPLASLPSQNQYSPTKPRADTTTRTTFHHVVNTHQSNPQLAWLQAASHTAPVKPKTSWEQASNATTEDRHRCPLGFLDICALCAHSTEHAGTLNVHGTPINRTDVVLTRTPTETARTHLLTRATATGFHGLANSYICGIMYQHPHGLMQFMPESFLTAETVATIYFVKAWNNSPIRLQGIQCFAF